jgi:hypothetical protein
MSLLVSLLNVNAEAALDQDLWSRISGETRKTATRCPSPFRASPRGRVTHLFGAH